MIRSIIVLSSLISFQSMAGIIQEEVYISNASKHELKMIQSHPELTIDHMNSQGFELYGPKGMKKWLQDAGINFKTAHAHAHNHSHVQKAAGYPSFKEIESFLKAQVAKKPNIAKLFSIGKSVEGRDLWVVKLSDNVNQDELEPEFKYISSMHGDEITGRELTQFFIKDLIDGYGKNQQITELINNTEIYIMVSMNPDGSHKKRRSNANFVDLNRNFPDWTRRDSNSLGNRQPETKAVMNFQKKRNFSLSANFHGGAVVANYPWDNTYDRHPFDDLVHNLSVKYASFNPEMRSSREFDDGVTNGADWYVLKGGMQDWSYYFHNDLQITIELSDKKWPSYRNIPGFYKSNKDSMLNYLESVHQGAGFKLEKSKTGRVEITQLNSDGSRFDRGSYGFSRGEFYKVLPAGRYEYKVEANNKSFTFETIVDESINENGNYQKINL